MAQAAAMGPPMSPRETRRSGRRSAPFGSTSTSKSPDSSILEPSRPKESSRKPPATASTSGSRSKRLKQEEIDDSVDDHRNTSSNGVGHQSTNTRTKRKPKDKEKQTSAHEQIDEPPVTKSKISVAPNTSVADGEEEEQGITRCVCGSTEDDPEAGEFMVQCETCQVWQHGPCMGYDSEDQLHDGDYYCEKCRPELHIELLKKLSKKTRHSSANSHHNSMTASSRISRSHSPSQSLKPSKRRNTMNSRDAAFDESLKEIMEATAAEAAAAQVPENPTAVPPVPEVVNEPEAQNKKKRKRTEDDSVPKKRTRSASTTPDHPGTVLPTADDGAAPPATGVRTASGVGTSKPSRSNKRAGGRKAQDVSGPAEVVETAPKRPVNSSRPKAAGNAKRAPSSVVSHNTANPSQEHTSSRRTISHISSGQTSTSQMPGVESSRAYRNSHAYVVSQQPLFTSWNLPDYLSHLEPMLPTHAPRPLEVRGNGMRESLECTMERGVKVKWPSKRMSVGDMNKRVRALVEWVGREQANALDRGRRREALEAALRASRTAIPSTSSTEISHPEHPMVLDADGPVQSPEIADGIEQSDSVEGASSDPSLQSGTMKIMEELMRELILFQEKFGPMIKTRDRERRITST